MVVVSLIRRSALMLGDPNFTRVSTDHWRDIWNTAQDELCTKVNLLEREQYFNVEVDDAYTYPEDMTALHAIWFTNTPSDVLTFQPLKEIQTEEEFRAMVRGSYPVGDPTHYWPRNGFFQLVPRPTTAYANGGKVGYYHLPSEVADINSAEVEAPRFAHWSLLDRLLVGAKRKLTRIEEAEAEYRIWLAGLETLRGTAEDRARDRRQSFQPRGMKRPFARMV